MAGDGIDLKVKMTDNQVERIEVEECPLCRSGSERHQLFDSIEESGYRERYQICQRCGLVFQSPRMSAAALDDFYAANYRQTVQGSAGPTEKDLRMQYARARHFIDFSTPCLGQVKKCLDIGSSAGILLETLHDSYGCRTLGIEPGEAYADFSRGKGFQVISDIKALELEHENSFDLITMGHTLEHIPEPADFLRTLRQRWLSPGGHLLLEVPNLFGHFSFERAHVIAFSKSTLAALLRRAGFEVLKVKVHGQPRSHLIPLYITIIARGMDEVTDELAIRSTSAGVKARRTIGMLWHRIASRFLTRWAWLPWPEVDTV
jgi:2-polyprenyl-3-methyl-5-hydroxy-6-metoxy-1,4-benzoquinol methylase